MTPTLHSSIWQRHMHTHTHTHAHLFLTLFMWQAKAPAGETHSTLYSLRTCDCGGKEGRRGRSEEEAQVEALVFRDVQLSLQYKQEIKKVHRAETETLATATCLFLLIRHRSAFL